MKICPRCHRQIPDNASICPDCSLALPKKKKMPPFGKRGAAVVVSGGVVIICLIFFVSLSQDHYFSKEIIGNLDFANLEYEVSFEGVTPGFLETARSNQAAALDESNPDSALSTDSSGGTSHIPSSPVSPVVPIAMSVSSVAKDTYYVGETWIPGSITFKIDYSDGSVKYDSYNVGTKNTVMKGPGTHTMTFTYYGYDISCTYDFKVLAEGSAPSAPVVSSAVTSAVSSVRSSTPASSAVASIVSGTIVHPVAISVASVSKTTYYVGEYWEPGTVNFRIDYSDGSVKYDSHNVGTQNTLMHSPGQQTVTFTYYGYDISCTYTFTVLAGTASSGSTSRSANAVPVAMSVAALTKDTYFVGEDFDYSSVSFKIDYSDGTSEFTSYNYDMRGFTSVVPGKVQVTFSVYGHNNISCTYVFTIVAKAGTSSATSSVTSNTSSGTSSGTSSMTSSTVSVAHTPENAVGTTVYIATPYRMVYHVGEAFDSSGLEVSIQFPDGIFFVDGYSLSGFDSSKPGTIYLRITYGKCDGGFTVTIVA